MIVTYYDTFYRDINTGNTLCNVVPKERCDFADRGLLMCQGILPCLQKNTPLEIKGVFNKADNIYTIKSYSLVSSSEHFNRMLLTHISNKLTDAQMSEIINISNGDLLEFIDRTDCEDLLHKIFKRSKQASKLTSNVMDGLKRIKENEEYVKLFIKYSIPLDVMDKMLDCNIDIKKFKSNPYIHLINNNIKIEKIDELAMKEFEIEEYSIKRLCGFVMACMYMDLKNGNTCIRFLDLQNLINYKLGQCTKNKYTITKSILHLCIKELYKYMNYQVYNNELYVYFNEIKKEEDAIINGLARLNAGRRKINPKYSVDEIEKKLNITYNQEQKNAFDAIKSSGVKILTGPPGSGKTLTLQGLIMAAGLNIVKLSATTGMAAQVMSNACNDDATTVHKMLQITPYGETFNSKNANNPIEADMIIVDEFSMAGLKISSILFNAIQNNCILLLVGDENQLESVEYGNVLHDLINSSYVEVYKLTEIIRSAGTICENAKRINNGIENLITNSEFIIKNCNDNKEAEKLLLSDYNADKNSQILCPVKKGELCTISIHSLLESDNEIAFIYSHKKFRIGDKVVMTDNNYDKGYINGDIGYIKAAQKDSVIIAFKNKTLTLHCDDYKNIEYADAITIHKSQGSEYDTVYIVLPLEANFMMSRKILYTAITRAKKKVYIYNVLNAVNTAIKNNNKVTRTTMLEKKLKGRKIEI